MTSFKFILKKVGILKWSNGFTNGLGFSRTWVVMPFFSVVAH